MATYLARANAARLELVTMATACRKRRLASTKFTSIEHRRHPDLLSDAPQRPASLALPNLRHHPLRQQAHRVRHVGGPHVAKVLHGHDVIHGDVGERAKLLRDGLDRPKKMNAASENIVIDHFLRIQPGLDIEVKRSARLLACRGVGLGDMGMEAYDVVAKRLRKSDGLVASIGSAAAKFRHQRTDFVDMSERAVWHRQKSSSLQADVVGGLLAENGHVKRHRPLDRLDIQFHRVQAAKLGVAGHPFARQKPLHDCEALVETIAFFSRVDIESFELMFEIAGAGAEHEAAIAKDIRHRKNLGRRSRIVKRKDRDRRSESDACRALGNRAEQSGGIRNHAIGMKMVLRGKERGISQFFSKDGLIDHLLVELGDGAGAIGIMVLDGKQRELQGGLTYRMSAFRKFHDRRVNYDLKALTHWRTAEIACDLSARER